MVEVGPFCESATGVLYRSCDCCFQTAVDDVWAGRAEADWRHFYQAADDGGICVCSDCLPTYRPGEGV